MVIALTFLFQAVVERGDMNGKRITVRDDDNGQRTIYEDIDQETVEAPRLVVVTFEPEYSRAVAAGDGSEIDHQSIISHPKAISDISRMLKMGCTLSAIERDREEKQDHE